MSTNPDPQPLSNSYMGRTHTLHPRPSPQNPRGLRLSPTTASTTDEPCLWTLAPHPQDSRKLTITTTSTSKTETKALDIVNDGPGCTRTKVCLAAPGFYAGQLWSLTPCPPSPPSDDNVAGGDGRGGWYKLSNDWTGRGWYLDTYADSLEAFMSEGEFSGQRWWIEGVGELAGEEQGGRRDSGWGFRGHGRGIEDGKREERWQWIAGLTGAVVAGFLLGRTWERSR